MPKPSSFTTGLVNSDIREWTKLIQAKRAINLAQGVCHVESFLEKAIAVREARKALRRGLHENGFNTYSHFTGVDNLRTNIARKAREYNGLPVSPQNVLVTNGASGAFACAVLGLVEPGKQNEVIVFEPFYTYHTFWLRLLGIVPRCVPLRPPGWSFDRKDLDAAWSPRTRAVVLNTPANPSGKVFTRDDLATIAAFCVEKDLWAISDEVYDFMVYDGLEHVSLATQSGMFERTVTVQSFSKPLSITGWRVGYALAHTDVLPHLGYVNEYGYVCSPTPLQHGVAAAFQDWRRFEHQRNLYQRKRDILCEALEAAGLPIYRPSGSIYVLADVRKFNRQNSVDVNHMLIDEVGVGAVPAHGFYEDESVGRQQLRFCFAVEDKDLEQAAQRLRAL